MPPLLKRLGRDQGSMRRDGRRRATGLFPAILFACWPASANNTTGETACCPRHCVLVGIKGPSDGMVDDVQQDFSCHSICLRACLGQHHHAGGRGDTASCPCHGVWGGIKGPSDGVVDDVQQGFFPQSFLPWACFSKHHDAVWPVTCHQGLFMPEWGGSRGRV